ncbi:hypothetical protein [Amycolatopsis pigmentata]|uniref:Uncharacterized protein n=1 Tax=Amycolatopsis pigmentata TaxID=450801 RepID=A0ABW5FIY0_9PSEU
MAAHRYPALNIRPYDAYFGIIGMFRAGYLLGVPDYTQTAWNALAAFMADMDGNGYTHDYVWANRQFRDGTINATGVLTSPSQAQFTPSDVGSPIIGTGLTGTVTIGAYLSATQVQLTGTTSVVATPQAYDILTFGPTGQWVTRAPVWADSTDSYAAMFLVALYAGFQATGDRARVQAFAPGALAALLALTTTRQRNGSFLGLPDGAYNVTLLEDAAEVSMGCRAAAFLFGPRQIIPGHTDAGMLAERYADQNQGFIRTLWDYTNPGRTISPVQMTAGSNQLTGAFLPGDVGSAISSGSPGVPLGAAITAVLPGGIAVLDRPATGSNGSGSVTTVVPGFRWSQNIDTVPQQDPPNWATLMLAYEQIWPVLGGVIDGRLATSVINHFLAAQPTFYADTDYMGGFGEDALLMAGRPTEALITALGYTNSTYNLVARLSPPFGYPFTIGKYGALMIAITADAPDSVIPPRA